MYSNDKRIVITLDAGGTNFVFSAMRGYDFIVPPKRLPSNADNLDTCLETLTRGFQEVIDQLEEAPAAISFAFPGPADYRAGIIGGYLPNFPAFRHGVALGPYLSRKFNLPVYINNDGDLFALGEALGGILPEINERIKRLGGHRSYGNLLGYTFGTGLGIGSVIDGHLNLGNNCCVETFCLPHKRQHDIIAEEGASIRAVCREFGRLTGNEAHGLTPYDIYLVAKGERGVASPSPTAEERAAAREAYALFGEVAGDVFATAVTLTDSLVVVGGGVAGAMEYIKPAILGEMRSTLQTCSGEDVSRVQMKVYDLDDDRQFEEFALGNPTTIPVYGSSDTVLYDPVKRTGIATSKLGASKAISIGAYVYALMQLDATPER